MAGNNVIQILRGTRDEIASDKNKDVKLNEGQLLYNLTDNYLTCGGENGTKINGLPVGARVIQGHYADNESGIVPTPQIAGKSKYRVGPVVNPDIANYDDNEFEIDSALGSRIILGSDFIKLSLSDGNHVTLTSAGFESSSGSSAGSVSADAFSAKSAVIDG